MSDKKIVRTFKELQEVDGIIGGLYRVDDKLESTKFGYAYKRFAEKNYMPILKLFREAVQDIRIDNALVDEKTKEILNDNTNPRGYKYSKQGLKDTIVAENKLVEEYDSKVLEIEPYICAKDSIPELTLEQKDKLKDLII